MSDDSTVTVEVTTEDDAPSETTNTVINVNESDNSDVTLDHERRITALEAALDDINSRLSMATETARTAEVLAETAVETIQTVAEESEEAIATVAEEAEAATPEVIEEVEDVAPNRDHPWFRGRKPLRSIFGSQS